MIQYHRDIYDDPSIGSDAPGLYFDKFLEKVGADRIWIAEFADMVISLAGLILDERETNERTVKDIYTGGGEDT